MVSFQQIGFVVDDIDDAIAHWYEHIGVAPIFVFRKFELAEYFFEGEPYEQVLSVAYGQAGPVQIELIQQHDDSPSLYCGAVSGAMHHVAIWTAHYDETLAAYRARGYEPVQWGNASGGDGQRFSYLGPNTVGPVLEITELSPAKAKTNRRIATLSKSFDGHDPIRDAAELATSVART
ncbi:MAG TPA: VOC family protein [Gemmatimonadaceae bacterium]|nr:VOC family protein [Gemmatimonadaceae bacterium]